MFIKKKAPIGVKEIAKLMGLEEAEVRAWPHLSDMRTALTDYNFGMLSPEKLVNRLNEISAKCDAAELYHYSAGISNAISVLKLRITS